MIHFYSNLWFFVSKFTEFNSKKLLKIYRRGLHTNEKLEKDTKVKDKGKIKEKYKEDKKLQKNVSCKVLHLYFYLLKIMIMNNINIAERNIFIFNSTD